MDFIRSLLRTKEYDFLRTNPHLGDNIILLGLGGSYAYDTATPGSDVDIRGCALNTGREILTNENFEQFVEERTDTVIYSFNKLVSLLSSCNPNTIELLGLEEDQYLYKTGIGQELIDNKKLFLSKRAIYSFGGYATSQLRRLDNKAARDLGQAQNEEHILGSIRNAMHTFPEKYFYFDDDSIRLYTDKAIQKDYETEIFMDISLKHYPLRDYKCMWSEMNNIVKDYGKLGKRNTKAIEHGKLSKHMMHLIRLYYMCLDILEREEIVTKRVKEHDELMAIRNGKYLDSNSKPVPEFFELVDELEKRLDYAAENTSLPDKPDYKRINDFVMYVNERVVRGTAKEDFALEKMSGSSS